MSDEKIQTPSTSAGLMRFYDVTSSNIQIDPRIIIGLCAGVIVLELLLQFLLQ